jgi:hypothetical protein
MPFVVSTEYSKILLVRTQIPYFIFWNGATPWDRTIWCGLRLFARVWRSSGLERQRWTDRRMWRQGRVHKAQDFQWIRVFLIAPGANHRFLPSIKRR